MIEYGGDKDVTNSDGETVLSIAQEHKYKAIIKEIGGTQENNTLGVSNEADYVPLFGGKSKKQKGGGMRMTTQRINNFADDILEASPEVNAESNEDQLRAMGTARLNDIADDIFDDIQTSLRDKQKNLMPLQSWLEKKQQVI